MGPSTMARHSRLRRAPRSTFRRILNESRGETSWECGRHNDLRPLPLQLHEARSRDGDV